MSRDPMDGPDRLASDLVQRLCAAEGLNEFFEHAFPRIAESFGAAGVILIDYHESTNHFDLLHFWGYEKQARFDLQHNLVSMDLEKALAGKAAYFAADDWKRLYLPLYFASVLEAVLVFESDSAIDMTPASQEIAKIVSKFLGLLMSSSRLRINQMATVDLNDLQRARQIQLTYLPSDNLETDRYEVYGYNRSSALIGGDYFDYFRIRNGSIQCVLADASGHGLSAALIMSTFRGLLHADIGDYHDCGALFTSLNQALYSSSSVVQYLTGVFLDFDERSNRLKYTNAGHFDPAIIKATGAVERLKGGGPPLGMFKNSSYPEAEVDVQSGDVLVLFTDGFTDLRDPSDDFFGEERILESVRKNRERSLNEIATEVLQEGIAFSQNAQPEDDLTLFMMRFR